MDISSEKISKKCLKLAKVEISGESDEITGDFFICEPSLTIHFINANCKKAASYFGASLLWRLVTLAPRYFGASLLWRLVTLATLIQRLVVNFASR